VVAAVANLSSNSATLASDLAFSSSSASKRFLKLTSADDSAGSGFQSEAEISKLALAVSTGQYVYESAPSAERLPDFAWCLGDSPRVFASTRCDEGFEVALEGELRPSVRPVMSGTRRGEYEEGMDCLSGESIRPIDETGGSGAWEKMD
jgi:hypothetical protein